MKDSNRKLKMHSVTGTIAAFSISLILLMGSCAPSGQNFTHHEGLYMPETLNDPLEPLNRGVWALNEGVLEGVIQPTARGYRMIVPSPARTSIGNFGYNLGYPGRALNQVLQGRFGDAGDESLRFATNTTIGIAGLFDVASDWEIPKHRGNFAQTFQTWGWEGNNFIVLPLLGPSDETSAVGLGADIAASPFSYYHGSRPVFYGIRYNKLSDQSEERVRMLKSNADAYDMAKAFWTYASKNDAPDWNLNGPRHPSTLETLAVATISLRDKRFLESMREDRVKVPTTGKKLPFSYWLQEEAAPLVYIVPGLGAHRYTMQVLSVAEGLYDRGYSVVAVSGLFHPEFIEYASSAKVPGYASADRKDVWALMGAIDSSLEREHGEKLGPRAMVGTSMGGFQALAMAAEAHTKPKPCANRCASCTLCSSIHIERFLAINPPVDLFYGLKQLDDYQEAPAKWPAAVRQQRINNAVHKAVAMAISPESLSMEIPPFDGVESKYLVGLTFRLTLRDAIYTSQRVHKLGNLERPLSWWNRKAVYHEILGLSFADYMDEIMLPHFGEEGVSLAQLEAESDLKRLAPSLASCSEAFVITSSNDFLLPAGDVAWLKRTFGSQRLTLLERGGHLGGLANPQVHELIAAKLSTLKSAD